ncbi:MAG: ferrochelatase [Candidatus Sericytochromatia bacterium]
MSLPGILLVNLGSPASTSVPDVRRYLDEFLMDERVIDIPWLARTLLIKGIILNTRPRKSAEAYAQVWLPEGSPLIHISRQVRDAVQMRTEAPVEMAMRYGQPSIAEGLRALRARNATEVRLVPLYPHYAMSSFETVVVKVQDELKALGWSVPLRILPPFYDDPAYIAAMVAAAQPYLEGEWDHLLFSYHGIPARHLVKADPTGSHCQAEPEGFPSCCRTPSEAHHYCYRHQALLTTEAFVKAAGIPAEKYSISFQSRLGRTPWLRPYTDVVLEELPKQGVKKVLVICPSFVSDCLETLEEIAMRGKESFEEAGGEKLVHVPCMNTHPDWIKTLVDWIHNDALFVGDSKGEKALSMASA